MSWIELTIAKPPMEDVAKMMPFDMGKEFAKLMKGNPLVSLDPSSQSRLWINLDRAKTIHFTEMDGHEVGVVVIEKLPYTTKEPAEVAALRQYLTQHRVG